MAGGTVGFTAEELQSGLLLGRESGAVAIDIAVERRIAGENGSDEAGEGARDFVRCKTDAGGGLGERQIHLVRRNLTGNVICTSDGCILTAKNAGSKNSVPPLLILGPQQNGMSIGKPILDFKIVVLQGNANSRTNCPFSDLIYTPDFKNAP
jgi:hypothetical protein